MNRITDCSKDKTEHWDNILFYGYCWHCGLGQCKGYQCTEKGEAYDEQDNWYCSEHASKIFN